MKQEKHGLVYPADYGNASPVQVAEALRRRRPIRHAEQRIDVARPESLKIRNHERGAD